MPPRFPPNSNMTQRPLQSEVFALNKLLGTDILEHSSRILDHFATTSKLGMTNTEPPPQLIEKLLEKCDDFDTVCDQIYYILEQSKTVLQLKYQQTNVTLAKKKLEAERQHQQQQQEEQQQNVHKSDLASSLDDDLALGFNGNSNNEMMDVDDTTTGTTTLDVEMVDDLNDSTGGTGGDALKNSNNGNSNTNHLDGRPHHVDDDDEWEELLQQQKDRLERMKKVMALGMDAATVNAEGGKVTKDDLLF